MHFLMGVGLLRSKVQCNTCGRDITWSVQPGIPEEFRCRCRNKVAGVKCSGSRSIKPALRDDPAVVHAIIGISYLGY